MKSFLQDAQVQNYIKSSQYGNEEILQAIYELVRNAVPDATEKIKWGMPVFSKEHDFCYIRENKDFVTLGFFSKESLNKVDLRLDGIALSMCHITIRSKSDIRKQVILQALKSLTGAKSILIIGTLSKYIMKCTDLFK